MKTNKLPSLALALALQALPLGRLFIAAFPTTNSSLAVVSGWIAGIGTLLGSYNSVSGASTRITSPTTATATNGIAFSYRVTTGPDAANRFSASNLPTGLSISPTVGRISGTPTVDGVFAVLLTASDNGRADRTVTATLTLTVKPAGGGVPVITEQPKGVVVAEGESTSLAVTATGSQPLRYLWRRNGAGISGATNATLDLLSVSTNHSGTYSVTVISPFGAVASSNAIVSVLPLPVFTGFQLHGDKLDLGFVRQAGAAYQIEYFEPTSATGNSWQQWTNWPANPTTEATTVTVSSALAASRLYQIKMTIP